MCANSHDGLVYHTSRCIGMMCANSHDRLVYHTSRCVGGMMCANINGGLVYHTSRCIGMMCTNSQGGLVYHTSRCVGGMMWFEDLMYMYVWRERWLVALQVVATFDRVVTAHSSITLYHCSLVHHNLISFTSTTSFRSSCFETIEILSCSIIYLVTL